MNAFLNRFKKVKWKHYGIPTILAVCTVLFAFFSLTGNLKTSTIYLLEKMSIAIILAVSLSVVVGYLGELSLGHAGFMCVGAYLGGKTAALLVPALGNGIPAFLVAMLVGGVCAAVCGFIIGLPALRLRGDYLAIVTLAFGEIVKVIFQQSSPESFGGTMGLSSPRYDTKYLFIIGFSLAIVCILLVQNLLRSTHGRAITAIRDSEIAARATGINVTRYKLLAFMVSAFFAGVAGVLFSYSNNMVNAPKFDYNYSIEILVMVVLGGMTINGSVIAAALITYLNVKLQTVLTGDLAVLKNLLYALIMVALVIYKNAPALKSVRDKYNLHNLFNKIFKPKYDPSVIKDDAGDWSVVPTKIPMDEILSVDLSVQESTLSPDKPDKGGKS